MTHRKSLLYTLLAASLIMTRGCEEDPADVDENPTIGQFSAYPTSVKEYNDVEFTGNGSDDKALKWAILQYGDGKADTVYADGKDVAFAKGHAYSGFGAKTATLILEDDKNQRSSATNMISVSDDPAPQFRQFSAAPAEEGTEANILLSGTDDSKIKSFRLDYGDGTVENGIVDSASVNRVFKHTYSVAGGRIVTARLTDDRNQENSRSITLDVLANAPPQIKDVAVNSAEGSVKTVYAGDWVTDKDPFTWTVEAVSAGLNITREGDSVSVSHSNEDANGSFTAKVVASYLKNGVPATVSKNFNIVLEKRDDVDGEVIDFFKDAYITLNGHPQLAMSGPYFGFAKIDGVKYSIEEDGTFESPKLPNQPHQLKARMWNAAGDSSFVAIYDLPAGDQTIEAEVMTNAGTKGTNDRIPLAMMLEYMNVMMFHGHTGGTIRSIKPQDMTIYFFGQNRTLNGEFHLAMTQDEMAYHEAYVAGLNSLFPPDKRLRTQRGAATDTIPSKTFVGSDNRTYVIPKDGYVWISEYPGPRDAEFIAFNYDSDNVWESADIKFIGTSINDLVVLDHEYGSLYNENGRFYESIWQDVTTFYTAAIVRRTGLDLKNIFHIALFDFSTDVQGRFYNIAE